MRRIRRGAGIGCLTVVAILAALYVIGLVAGKPGAASHYPPRTAADLRALAASSDASLQVVSRPWSAVCACHTPIRVLVPRGIRGQAEVAALARVFFDNGLDRPARAIGLTTIVWGVRRRSDLLYSAGRIMLDFNGARPTGYTVDVEGGPVFGGREFRVTP